MSDKIGMTEGSDAALDCRWHKWVREGRPAVLLTKDPGKLYEQLKTFENYNVIIHCTITGNGGTEMEPNVPKWEESLLHLEAFVKLLDYERVVLRIDPIIPTMPWIENSYKVLTKARELLGEQLRVRISIYDNYKHAKKRIKDAGIDLKCETFHYPLYIRKSIWNRMGKPDTCGEPGLPDTPCISEIDCKILGVEPGEAEGWQRKVCGCLNNKYELTPAKQPCAHGCKYCFWKNKENL